MCSLLIDNDFEGTADMCVHCNTQRAATMHYKAHTARQEGDFHEAITLFSQAIDFKIDSSVSLRSISNSHQSLGETYLEHEVYDAAIDEFKHALAIRQALQPRESYLFLASESREWLAQAYEARLRPDLAAQTRDEGAPTGEICCANFACENKILTKEDLMQCGSCHVRRLS